VYGSHKTDSYSESTCVYRTFKPGPARQAFRGYLSLAGIPLGVASSALVPGGSKLLLLPPLCDWEVVPQLCLRFVVLFSSKELQALKVVVVSFPLVFVMEFFVVIC
jgi:hypothetical protein